MLAALLALPAQAADVHVVNVGWAFVGVFALDAGDGVVVVDSHYRHHEKRILRRLEHWGVDPARVKLVLLTHGHADHAGSAKALHDRLGVPVAAGAGEVPMLAAGEMRHLPFTNGIARLVGPSIHRTFPAFAPDLVVTDPLDLAPYGLPGAEAVVVGGHTPGSLVVKLPDHVVLVGDLMRSKLMRHHRPTIHFVQTDVVAAHAALDALVAEGFTTFYPSHGGVIDREHLSAWLDGKRHRQEDRVVRRGSGPQSRSASR